MKNVEELIFEMEEFDAFLRTSKDDSFIRQQSKSCDKFIFNTQKVGDIYLSNSEVVFDRDVVVKAEEGMECVMLSYVLQNTGACGVNQNTGKTMPFCSNSCNIYFSHKDNISEQDFFAKEQILKSKVLYLSAEYFQDLAENYSEMLGGCYQRYLQGESFYLREQFVPTNATVYHILSQLENSHLMGNCQKAYVDAKVLELLCLQFQPVISSRAIKNIEKIKEAEYILLSDIRNPPSVRDLALQVGLNEYDFRYGFKEVFDNTVYGYLFDYKMQLAEQLLRDTTKSITEVAMQCGYNYPSHFCTAFKRKFGITPNKIRK